MLWRPAKDASVPNLLPRARLETANQLTLATTYGVTPVVAALLLAGLTTGLGSSYFIQDLPAWFDTERSRPVFQRADIPGHRAHGVLRHQRRFRSAPTADNRVSASRACSRSSSTDGHSCGKTPLVRGLVLGILGAFAAGGRRDRNRPVLRDLAQRR